jgi:protein SCO1
MTRGCGSLLLALLAGILMLTATGIVSASEFRTSDVTGQGYGDAFPTLVDQEGRARTREDFNGHVTVLLFGFTHCPDLCPTSLSNLAVVLDQLGEDRDRVQIVFITVDPERDTSGVLRDYLSGLGPNFIGLTGGAVAIRKAAKTFKVFFQKKPLPDGDYTMDHSAVIYILDPQARARLMFTARRQPKDVAHDILQLLHQTS